ncbi:MAG: hypothetical protein AAFY50_20705 [Cyanobacteria bacterium J06648_1]
MSIAEQNIKKFILGIFKITSIFFALLVISIFIYSVFWAPDEKKARSLVRSIFHYYPPTSTKLIFSKNYWASFDGREPRSMCLLFQYSQKDFADFQNINFLTKNNKDSFYSSSPIADDKGCVELNSNSEIQNPVLFTKNFEYFHRLEGGTILADTTNKVVMFEIYLFD